MNPEDFARVKAILIAARELPRDQRAAFLERECGDDAALRAEVESLLAHETGAPSLIGTGGLGRGLGAELPRSLARALGEETPERIGPYRILEVLGEGGMGTVYRAEQTEPIRREVALKLVRRGLDGTRAAARFEVERRALALMNHPNIARVLDAGTDETGRPYFVMELVRGDPITSFCDREKLSVRERVELMIPICRAVQHAHRKGILHRDLKPSNVLVAREDGKPVPKVIDFGIAKAVQDTPAPGTLLTAEGQLVGTPEYMSPEQAGVIEAEVDTRTDVYALGVILYELLTGRRPHRFRNATPLELHRVLSRDEPEKPSTACTREPEEAASVAANAGRARGVSPTRLRRELAGDLDTIVLMALRREPERRYGSAEHLAEDLRRYLDGLPVLARKDTVRYRAGKFARRHRVAVGAAAVLVLSLAVLAVTMTVQSARVARERDRAVVAEARARNRPAGDRFPGGPLQRRRSLGVPREHGHRPGDPGPRLGPHPPRAGRPTRDRGAAPGNPGPGLPEPRALSGGGTPGRGVPAPPP
jgi:serine/threonine protein kinase